MTTTSTTTARTRHRYHHDAYQFLSAALRHAQKMAGRIPQEDAEDEAHITGVELLDGLRDLARRQFGLLARTVFRYWGIDSTEDFGRMVFELIDRGEMKKTENDHLADFVDVYDFDVEFDRNYRIDTTHAFRN